MPTVVTHGDGNDSPSAFQKRDSRYHDCLKTEFQHLFGANPKNAIVVWQLQAMTGNDEHVSQHGTNHGISE